VPARHGLAITELPTRLQGQLVAVHPACNEALDAFRRRRAWAAEGDAGPGGGPDEEAAQAFSGLSFSGSVSFTGALMRTTALRRCGRSTISVK
jgi:hypothetical protein